LLAEQEWPSFCGERASGVEWIRQRKTDEITTCVSDVRKKCDLGCQSKETYPKSMRLQYELIGNRLYSLLPIRQRSVTDLSSPLIMGY
jgi:hypothetical protein